MRYIVLTTEQKDYVIDYKNQWKDLLESRFIDYEPIEIKNNLWILPESLLTSIDFRELKEDLEAHGKLEGLEIREVLEDELIVIEE